MDSRLSVEGVLGKLRSERWLEMITVCVCGISEQCGSVLQKKHSGREKSLRQESLLKKLKGHCDFGGRGCKDGMEVSWGLS